MSPTKKNNNLNGFQKMYHLLLSFQVCEFHRYLPADKWMLCAVPGTKYFGNNQHFATYHARRNQVSWKHFHCYWSYVAGSELASLNWWWCGKGSQWDSFYGCPKMLATASSQVSPSPAKELPMPNNPLCRVQTRIRGRYIIRQSNSNLEHIVVCHITYCCLAYCFKGASI